MSSVVPSLSTQGWLTTIGEKADRLLSYFFASEFSQSIGYYGKIASLPYLVAIYKSKPTELRVAIDTALNTLLSSFFEQTLVNVRVEADDDSETKYTIHLSTKIIDKGIAYELSHIINIKDSMIAKVAKIANG